MGEDDGLGGLDANGPTWVKVARNGDQLSTEKEETT
jgi:hypothetical protein